jgi:adenylate kinase family enzyme
MHPPNHTPPARLAAIAGRTRAGKTTLTDALSAALGWPSTSFSAYVRATAADRGLPEERRTLQDLGAEMIEETGPRGFVEGALAHADLDPRDGPLLIEGARHVRVWEALREVASPLPAVLIYLAVSDSERDRRLAAEGISDEEGRKWEEHSTEYEVLHLLPSAADLVLDADQPKDYVANSAVEWLDRS